jgi:hypothetical protein
MNAEKPSRWSRLKGALVRTEKEFAFLKGLTVVSVLGTMLVGYFQYLSAYEDKVTTQYKEDFTGAAAAFTEISNAFATAQTLQHSLYFNYKEVAGTDLEKNAQSLQAKTAHDIYMDYSAAYISLRQNIDLLARKVEMQIDWASDRTRDPGAPRDINVDPLTRTKLGEYNFDCDKDENMPHFKSSESAEPVLPKICDAASLEKPSPITTHVDICAVEIEKHTVDSSRPPIRIDWYSAKHHVWTMYYCFYGNHSAIEAARQWASKSRISSKAKEKLDDPDAIENRLDLQVLRLQAFMSLAMLRLDNIRVKYRPNGFLCHVPIVREVIDAFSQRCSPIHTTQG